MSLIRLAVDRTDIRIIAIARRESGLPPGARMEVLVADPENWAMRLPLPMPILVCALGTTWKKAGKDEAAFRAVDQELVLACGKRRQGCGRAPDDRSVLGRGRSAGQELLPARQGRD
jgi:hypothetical protein